MVLVLVMLWLGPDAGRQTIRDELVAGWEAVKATARHIRNSIEDAFQPPAAESQAALPKATGQ